ncbi:DUF6174 domain-containing protein [Treponema zioleckii]|uniref:DUF6174 domain-containing protein n=1 Tax=Treponema zioleckii TaxID=331680 RepID=UPI00168B1BEA|nr:DUF6174 domain-containing protein [Treponema zioleckii]
MFFLGFLPFTVFSCCDFKDAPSIDFDVESFSLHQTAWNLNSYTNYSFSFVYESGCSPKKCNATVSVTNGISSVSCGKTFVESIDALYEEIYNDYNTYKAELDSGKAMFDKIVFKINYDDTYHYPSSVRIEIWTDEDAGGDWSVTISDFKLLM